MKWKCIVCDYIHEGEEPPEYCPICGVDASNFVKIEDQAGDSQVSEKNNSEPRSEKDAQKILTPEEAITKAIRSLSYGLFIITASYQGRNNGQTANTCFQITSEPVQLAIGINKNNLTHEFIQKSGKFGVSILDRQGHDLARRFGYRSGREIDKFAGLPCHRGQSGVLLPEGVLANLEAEVVNQLDCGTHTLFLGKVTAGEYFNSGEPMTYAYFRSTK
jgi:flavin reductase (DIM6/NTAB) family NADH-FMN oxidoreductase RutF